MNDESRSLSTVDLSGCAQVSRGFADGETRPALTPRQWEVLRLLRDGQTCKRIAADRSLSVQTVKNHVTHIHERLGVSSTIEAVWAMRRELEP